jgi:hypothetical protein
MIYNDHRKCYLTILSKICWINFNNFPTTSSNQRKHMQDTCMCMPNQYHMQVIMGLNMGIYVSYDDGEGEVTLFS